MLPVLSTDSPPFSTHGPLIHSRAVSKVEHHVQDAVKRGAKLLVGGNRMEGNFFEPTVLGEVPSDAACMNEETFGPMGALIKFKSEEEVIEKANDTEVGLAGYFYSKDGESVDAWSQDVVADCEPHSIVGRVFRVAEALEVGMVSISVPGCFGNVDD
jgi:succinate-semialdehyde dehydrogenase/glutarate-semialdehyde dehydrogenase